MKPLDECLYYLVREDFNNQDKPGKIEKDVYFNDTLTRIRKEGLPAIRQVELRALVAAAKRRGRLGELDEVMGYDSNENRVV